MNKIVIALIIAVAAAGPAVASEETEVMAAVSTIRPVKHAEQRICCIRGFS